MSDPAQLAPAFAADYYQARALADAWIGERESVDQAETLIRKVLAEYPKFLPAYVESARLAILRAYLPPRDPGEGSREAEAILMKALALNPRYAKAHVLLGHVYFNSRQYDLARKHLAEAERIGTKDPWLHINWATVLQAEGNIDEASKRYIRVLEEGTDNIKALSATLEGLLVIAGLNDTNPTAKDYATLASKLRLSPVQQRNLAGRMLEGQRSHTMDVDLAKALLDKLLAANPQDVTALVLLGNYHLIVSHRYHATDLREVYQPEGMEQALLAYYQATKIAPDARAYAGIARVMLDQGNLESAREAFASIDKKNLRSPQVDFERARLQYLSGDIDGGVRALESFLDAGDARTATARRYLISIHVARGNLDEAEQQHKLELRQEAGKSTPLGSYAYFLYVSRGNVESAQAYALQALALGYDSVAHQILSASLFTRAALAYKGQRKAEARTLLMQALSVEPRPQPILDFMSGVRKDGQELRSQIHRGMKELERDIQPDETAS